MPRAYPTTALIPVCNRRPAALLALVLTLAAVAGGGAPVHASTTQLMTFEAPRDLLDPSARDAALTQLESLGVHALRVVLYWHDVAPDPDSATRPDFDATDPTAYDWGQYDALLAEAASRNWKVVLTISGPVPRWATAGAADTVTRPSPAEFTSFVTAVGKHYGAQVNTWSIWNEPNHPQFLAPQYVNHRPASPRIYRALFLAGWEGLRASGNGDDRVLMGETAPRGTGKDVAPLTFLRGALCLDSRYRRDRACANLPASGYAHHAYTTRAGPLFRPPGPNDVTIGVLGRLVTALDRAARAGAIAKHMRIWLTEFGIQSHPDRLLGVPLALQSDYRSLSERIAYENPRVAAFSQYLLRDDPPRPGSASERYSGFESGLRFADGRAKPSFDGFRLPIAARRQGRRVSVWGLVRPATGVTRLRLQFARGKSFSSIALLRTDARGYWRWHGRYRGGHYRVRWTGPDGSSYLAPATAVYG